jgi:hypothetical protein
MNDDDNIIFYENGRGGAAVSLDGGVSVIVPTGRSLNLADTPVWEETDFEHTEVLLTRVQQKALQDHLDRGPLTPLEEMAENLRRESTLRKRRENAPQNFCKYRGKLGERTLVVLSETD